MTTPVRTIEILREARERITPVERWTQGAYARRHEGATNFLCDANDPTADCWCVAGTVFRSCSERGLSSNESFPLIEALHRIARRDYGRESLFEANDFFGHLAALSILDAAIRELEEAEGES